MESPKKEAISYIDELDFAPNEEYEHNDNLEPLSCSNNILKLESCQSID